MSELLTIREFAEKVKVTEQQVYCWIRAGDVKAVTIGRNTKRIPSSELAGVPVEPKPRKRANEIDDLVKND